MKRFTFIILASLIGFTPATAQCTYTQSGQLSSTITFASIINCPGGDVILNNINSKANASGKIIFDSDVTLNSLTINFANGNKPAEFIIPSGVTVTIANDLIFNGQPSKDKFLTVEGVLIVGGALDFGGIPFEIDGLGTIDSKRIIGADNVSCSPADGGSATCPLTTTESCSDGSGSFCSSTLPVELASFDLNVDASQVNITWVTTSELNNDFFTLERSSNGIDYHTLAYVNGGGNSNAEVNYEYTDESPLYGQAYYRLKQTDYDGTTEVFSPKGVYVSGVESVNIFPNPARQDGKLQIVTGAQEGETVMFYLYNSTGNLVMNETLSATASIKLIPDVDPGLYTLKVMSGKNIHTQKLLIR